MHHEAPATASRPVSKRNLELSLSHFYGQRSGFPSGFLNYS